MGSRMAANLIKEGHNVTVYNRSAQKAKHLREQGATSALTIVELAEAVDIIFTMLSTPEVVSDTAEQFLPRLKEGSWWIDCSTVNPSFSRQMDQLAKAHGVHFADAPVAGSKAPAEQGELLFLAGGKEEDLIDFAPFFSAMGKKTLYLNEVGNGANMKMLINLMLAQSMATFSEAIKLGKGMGLDESLVLNILTATPVVSPVMGLLKDRLLNREFDVNFPLKWIHKDIMLALDTASELDVTMPSLEKTEEIFKTALDERMGEMDFSAVYQSLID